MSNFDNPPWEDWAQPRYNMKKKLSYLVLASCLLSLGSASAVRSNTDDYFWHIDSLADEEPIAQNETPPSSAPPALGTRFEDWGITTPEGGQLPNQDFFPVEEFPTQPLPTTQKQPTKEPWETAGESPPMPADATTPRTIPFNDTKSAPKARSQTKTAQKKQPSHNPQATTDDNEDNKVLVNFSNVKIAEYLKFLSRIANKNFVFNEADLNFNVTIVSEERTSIDNLITALVQELRINGLSLIEKDDVFIIHNNPAVQSITRVSTADSPSDETEFVTQVFTLNTLDPNKAAVVIQPLVTNQALVEVLEDTNHLIVTDVVSNVRHIAQLIKSMDSPTSGMVIGQFVAQNTIIESLIQLTQQIMLPIAQAQPLTIVPHNASNSIFVVSTPFIVEKTISVLQHLDQTEGVTRIYNLDDLKISPTKPGDRPGGQWELRDGKWVFRSAGEGEDSPDGEWRVDENGNWYFVPKGYEDKVPTKRPVERKRPEGDWRKDVKGDWIFQLAPKDKISAEPLERRPRIEPDLPVGHVERTRFFIHKLQYRKGEDIQNALANIGTSLEKGATTSEDLITTINSVQWIEASNALVFSGTAATIDKVRELVEELDMPLRQVFIEMLILETTLDDSLNYAVNPGARFGGADIVGAEHFLSSSTTLPLALNTAGIRDGMPLAPDPFSTRNPTISDNQGYQLGIIGQNIRVGDMTFNTLGALVNALHRKTSSNIVMNPKIITEDNVPAEIFVGVNTRFQSNSISNDEGSIVTSNFEYRDVGTLLKVTPFLGNGDIVTLEIEQSVSRVIPTAGASSQNDPAGPETTSQNRTMTRVHVPDGYFLVLSGMMQDENTLQKTQVPCLGGIPILGAAFKDKQNEDRKSNTMIFIRPQIIDTVEQAQNLTKHQQDIWEHKNRTKKDWLYETDQALDFFNIETPDRDTQSWGEKNYY